jgi:phosphoglycerate dehydrogenase-like enzyme
MKAAFFAQPVPWVPGNPIDYVYASGRREAVASLTELHPVVITRSNFAQETARLADLEVIFSTWGMPVLDAAQVAQLTRLRAVFYAAGSVAHFARPFLERGIPVVSAKRANADSVAEFCFAQILLGMKGYFRNTREYLAPAYHADPHRGPGNCGDAIAILGAGEIGLRTLELLRPYPSQKLVVSRHLSEADAAELGARKVTLPEAFAQAHVVSNHLADLPGTKGALSAALFRVLRPGAVFINTGRGAQVVEADLVAVLRERPDLTALLDVTDPEPPAADSPLFRLPNVRLTTHIAGAFNNEAPRLADLVIEEFRAFREGRPLRHAVSLSDLERKA